MCRLCKNNTEYTCICQLYFCIWLTEENSQEYNVCTLDGRINKSKKDNSNFKYDFRQISTSFLSETNLELSVLAKDKVAPPHLLPSKFNKYTLYSEKLSADTQ